MATYTKIILRRDTRANWAAVNPILSEGEIGVETDTRRFKIGLGNAHWNDLKYSTPKITGSTINENGELSLLYEDSDTPLAIGKVRGTSVSNQYVEYGVSDDNVTEPVSWQSTLPLVAKGKYLWTKTVTQYDDPDRDDTITYSYSRQGDDGRDGIDGNDGRSIRSILKTSLTPDENNDDTYTITYSDNTTETFKVHAGTNAEQYYIHYVYADNIGAGVTNETANYSKTETRKYIGVYVDKTAADAASYSEANGKSGIIWSQVTGTNGVSAYSLSLNNDFDTIPCNMYGAVTYTASDWLNQTSHTLTAFCGTDRIEFKVVYQTLPTNATGYTVVYTPISIGYVLDTTNEAGNIATPVSTLSAHLSSINANKGYVEYVLYKDRNKLASKTFEVSKLSAGADAVDYWLTADTQTIKINKEGQVSPATINVEFYKQVGQNDAELNLETKYRWYRIGERDATMQAATTTNGKATISVPSNITAGLIIEFVNNDGTIIYDRETIVTAIDGIDGIDGDSFHMKANAEACTAIGDAYIGADKHIHVVKALEPTITFEDVGEIGGPQGERGNSYWLNVSSPIHTGTQQSEAITIDAMRKIGDNTEEPDTDAYIRYKFADETWSSKTNNGWVKTNSITLDSSFTDKDLVIEAAHKPASNYIKFDTETITYSPKNTPVLDLSNDNDAIAYSESGKLDASASVSSTAHVYLNGADITSSCRISWAAATATISVSGATVTVSGLTNYQEVITCTVDNIPDYSGLTLTKDFTVTKQVKGTSINNVAEFYLATNLDSGVTTSTSGWVETTAANATMPQIDADHPYLWNYERISLSNNQFQTTAPVLVGTYSEDGQPGRGIVSIIDYYYISSSTNGNTLPEKGDAAWKTTPDNVNSTDKYLWNYEVITYTTGDSSSSTPSIIGAYGDKGDDGDNGTSISGVEEYYLATSYATGVTAANGAWGTWQKDTVPAISESAQYLWNYEKIIGTDKDNQSVVINTTVPAIIGKWSQDGQDGQDGQNGRGIVSIVNYYKASSDGTTAPSLTPVWATSPADGSATLDATNKYLWNYEEITYDRESSVGANDITQTSTPSVIGVFGKDGKDGQDGKDGVDGKDGSSISTVDTKQYRLSTSNSNAEANTSATWSDSILTPTTDNPYVWERTKTVVTTNGTAAAATYSTPTLYQTLDGLVSILEDDGIQLVSSSTDANNNKTYHLKADNLTGAVSNNVTIAGWTVNNNALYNTGNNTGITAPGGTTGGIWLSTGVQGTTTAQIGGTNADKNWFLAANDKFGVTTGGDIYTKDATINVQKLKIQRDSELATTTTGYKNAFKIDDTVPLIDIKNSGIRYVDMTTKSITYTKKVICSVADVQIVASKDTNKSGQVTLSTDMAHSEYPYQLGISASSFDVVPNDDSKAGIQASSDPFRYFITFKLSDPVDVPVYMNFMLVAEPTSSFQGTATTADALWNANDVETAWISGGDIGATWNAGGDIGAAWVAGGDVGAVWDAGGDIGAISDQPGAVVFAPGITEASVEIAHLGLDLAYLANIGAIVGGMSNGALYGVYLNIYITGLTASGWTLYDTGHDNSWAIKKECQNKPNLSIKGNLIPDLAVKSGYLVPSSDYNLGVDNAPWERGFINTIQSRAISVNKITNSTASETTIGSEAYPYTKAYIRELWVDEIHIKNSTTTSTGTSAISSTNTMAWKGFETVSGRVVIDGEVMYIEPETYTENGVSSTSSDTDSSSGSSSGSGSGSTGSGSSTTPYIGGGGGGGGCFEAGTKIAMADGSLKNIEDIQKGEKVLSYDVYTNTLSEQEVDMPVELVEPLDNVQLIFSDGTVLNTTMTHPFWTTDGWVSLKPNFDYNDFYKDLKEQFTEMMQVGQKFFKVKGHRHKLKKVKLLRIRYYHGRPANHKVYNLSIKNYATFFANGILGHNINSKQIMVIQDSDSPVIP